MSRRSSLKCPLTCNGTCSVVVWVMAPHRRGRGFNARGRRRRERRDNTKEGMGRPRSVRCPQRTKADKCMEGGRTKRAMEQAPENNGGGKLPPGWQWMGSCARLVRLVPGRVTTRARSASSAQESALESVTWPVHVRTICFEVPPACSATPSALGRRFAPKQSTKSWRP